MTSGRLLPCTSGLALPKGIMFYTDKRKENYWEIILRDIWGVKNFKHLD
jgi:hypothetical protein